MAQEALREIGQFLEDEVNFDFVIQLEDERGFPVNLRNKEFWHRILDVYP